jgi:hypothetical protein
MAGARRLAGARASDHGARGRQRDPDYHQDRLVGKRNLCVALGASRRHALPALAAPGCGRPVGVVAGVLPWPCLAALLRCRSWSRAAAPHADVRDAARLRSAVRSIVTCYLVAVLLVIAGCCARGMASAARTPSAQLRAPLFVSWQITRDCDLCCLHCCTESAPGKRLPDELDADEAMRVADEIVALGVPYVMLCGGEPLVVPHFLDARRAARQRRRAAQDRDQRPALRRRRRAARAAADPLDPDQPRRRQRRIYARQRVTGSLAAAHAACRACARAGMPLEVTFAPTRINLHEAEAVIERRAALGAFRFNTRPLMRSAPRRGKWHRLEPSRGRVDGVQVAARSRRDAARRRARALLRAVRDRRRPCASAASPPATLARAANGWVKVAARFRTSVLICVKTASNERGMPTARRGRCYSAARHDARSRCGALVRREPLADAGSRIEHLQGVSMSEPIQTIEPAKASTAQERRADAARRQAGLGDPKLEDVSEQSWRSRTSASPEPCSAPEGALRR